MLQLSWPQAAAWRVHRQYLDRRAPAGSLLAVASRLCGLHAQLMSSAELTVWARVEHLDRREVQRALWQDRTLIKTWAMRGTLHLLPSSELPLWHAALSTSPRYWKPALWLKHFGITQDELERLTEAVGAALDGRILTREELAQQVNPKLAESSWGTILKPAAFTGRLCFGPSVGQRVRFTRPDTWLAEAGCTLGPAVDPQVAQAEVTRRFLAAYGPASHYDLARWWNGGSGVSTAKQWIASLGTEVCPVEVQGAPAWMLADDAREARELSPSRSVRLLPGFDQYVVGASYHAKHLLPGDLRNRVYRPQGWISPVLLVNGLMQGVWRYDIQGSQLEVVIEPFVKVAIWVRRGVEQEAERLAAFLGCRLSLIWRSAQN